MIHLTVFQAKLRVCWRVWCLHFTFEEFLNYLRRK